MKTVRSIVVERGNHHYFFIEVNGKFVGSFNRAFAGKYKHNCVRLATIDTRDIISLKPIWRDREGSYEEQIANYCSGLMKECRQDEYDYLTTNHMVLEVVMLKKQYVSKMEEVNGIRRRYYKNKEIIKF